MQVKDLIAMLQPFSENPIYFVGIDMAEYGRNNTPDIHAVGGIRFYGTVDGKIAIVLD